MKAASVGDLFSEITLLCIICADGRAIVATAKKFAEFWLENSVHADERHGAKRGRADVQRLAVNLISAAAEQGFSQQQMEAELGGDIYAFIRTSIDRQNKSEDDRLLGKK
jgi:hypothetical protein